MTPSEKFIAAVQAANIKESDWQEDIIDAIPCPVTRATIRAAWNTITEGEDPRSEFMREWLEEQSVEIDDDLLAISVIEWRSPTLLPQANCDAWVYLKNGVNFTQVAQFRDGNWSCGTTNLLAWATLPDEPKL